MKDILIKINKETRMVTLDKTTIGNDGESLQAKLIFSFEDEFVDGQARLEYTVAGQSYYAMVEKVGETYELPVLPMLTKKGQIDMQLVISSGDEDIAIFKSNVFYLYCNKSIDALIEEVPEYAEWIDIANIKLEEINNLNLNVEKTDNVSTVSITKSDGTVETVEIYDGEPGPQGPQGAPGSINIIPVTELPTENIDESAIYIIPSENPDEENLHKEYVYVNGAWEPFGDGAVKIDLSDYPTKEEMEEELSKVGGYPTIKLTGHGSNNTISSNDFPLFEEHLNKMYQNETMYPLFLIDNLDYYSGLFVPINEIYDGKLYMQFGLVPHYYLPKGAHYVDNGFTLYLSWTDGVCTITRAGLDGGNYVDLDQMVAMNNAQTISGTKTFTTLPKTSVVPTDDTHMVNKKYVDDAIDAAVTTSLEASY